MTAGYNVKVRRLSGGGVLEVANGGYINMLAGSTISLVGATLTADANSTITLPGNSITGAKLSTTGIKAASFVGTNATGSITVTGAVAGDRVLACFRSDNASNTNAGANFETTISTNNAIQQVTNTNCAAQVFSVLLIPASA